MVYICKGFEQMIQNLTRLTNNTRILIDHTYTNSLNYIPEAGCLDTGVSNHMMVYAIREGRDGQSISSCKHRNKRVRVFGTCDEKNLPADLQVNLGTFPWNDTSDIDHLWSRWKETIETISYLSTL